MPKAPKWLFDVAEKLMPKLPLMEVSSTELLSPAVKKICFTGDFDSLAFPVGCYIDFRVSDTEVRRYTVSNADINNRVLDFIVHLHAEAPGSSFMNQLKAGDKIDLNKPRGERRYYDEAAEKFVIFGDETSLALACSFLPVLKKNKHAFQFYFELDDQNKNLPAILGLENCTVFPKNGSFKNEAWISSLPAIQAPEWQDARFVLTGNVASAQAFRKVIKSKTKGKIVLQGYWLEGKQGL